MSDDSNSAESQSCQLSLTGLITSLRRLFAYAQQPTTFKHPEANPSPVAMASKAAFLT
jgi:hypothetical protein